jgi:calcineurin-like phosphoesterase
MAAVPVALILAIAAWWAFWRSPADAGAGRIPGEGDRVTVEVLNATNVNGLARQTTRRLRRRGIDVVYFGQASDADADSTAVIARRGDIAAARRVQAALGVGQVLEDPDPHLLLDVTVVLGRDAAAATSTRN